MTKQAVLGSDRPRERLMALGARVLSDAELLTLMLGSGDRAQSAQDTALLLLRRFQSLRGVAQADLMELMAAPGIGAAKAVLLKASLELARRCSMGEVVASDVMSSPQSTRRFLRHHLRSHRREVFCCLFLNSQNQLIRCEDLFWGTLDGAAVYPREVVARALQLDAAAVILAHNHPSGVAEPSQADRRITQRLQEALALMDIRVLDHLIVGAGEPYSFAEAGLL